MPFILISFIRNNKLKSKRDIKMDEVLRQAPIDLSDDIIIEAFNRNNKNVKKTLMELWDIPEEIPKDKNKWDEIRETCDAYDTEMNRLISNIRNSTKNNE